MPRNKRAGGEVPNLAGFHVAQFEASDFVFDGIVNILHHSIGEEMNFRHDAARVPA